MKNADDTVDNGPLSGKTLAAGAVQSVIKMQVIKWTVIIVATKLARRAIEKSS